MNLSTYIHRARTKQALVTLFTKDAPFISKLNELCEKNPSLEVFVKTGLNVDALFFIGIDLDTDKLIFKDQILTFFLQGITENP